jgi:hypothetical protein
VTLLNITHPTKTTAAKPIPKRTILTAMPAFILHSLIFVDKISFGARTTTPLRIRHGETRRFGTQTRKDEYSRTRIEPTHVQPTHVAPPGTPAVRNREERPPLLGSLSCIRVRNSSGEFAYAVEKVAFYLTGFSGPRPRYSAKKAVTASGSYSDGRNLCRHAVRV